MTRGVDQSSRLSLFVSLILDDLCGKGNQGLGRFGGRGLIWLKG